MGIWRRWRKAGTRQSQKKNSGAAKERTRGDSRVEWEFGEHDVPIAANGSVDPGRRDGLTHREHSVQRHGRGFHRTTFAPRPKATRVRPYATPPQESLTDPADELASASAFERRPQAAVHRSASDPVPVEIASIELPGAQPDTTELPRPHASEIEHAEWESDDGTDLRDAFRSVGADARVRSVRQALELALDEWWSQQKLLSPPLLRNGLLVLEAGHKLDEAYLSLLLRSALRLRRGMVTALRHQTDPDRAAYLLKEALLYEPAPLSTETLWRLRQEDPESDDWVALLHYDLEQDAQTLTGERQQLALAAMRQLESAELLLEEGEEPQRPRLRIVVTPRLWSVGRAVIIALLLFMVLVTGAWNRHRSRLNDVAFIPAGTYTVANEQMGVREVTIPSLAMDRTEVTNRSYRICYEQGECTLPQRLDSATRSGYFFDPAFDFYPVVNIDWESASRYCAWAGKRLPTLDEWEVAASVAPITARHYVYPWGDVFQRQYANTRLSGIGDTQRVGLYHPLGSSSFGVADLAGNVAEWTTFASSGLAPLNENAVAEEQTTYIAKGGSYLDGSTGVEARTYVPVEAATFQPWLGFRCVTTVPDDKQRAVFK